MKPIIFSGSMVEAILDGRKTQMRRAIKPQPFFSNVRLGSPTLNERHELEIEALKGRCPYGQPGDLLWVRETWAIAPLAIHYRADNNFKSYPDEPRLLDYESTRGWRPSIHMPRWASRLTLEITSIDIQRVQDISEDDAFAEGIDAPRTGPSEWGEPAESIHQFAQLWDSINAKRGYGWVVNPWFWVIEFQIYDSHKTD